MSVIEDMIQAYDQVFLVEKKCSYEAIITDNIFSERLKLCNTENEKKKVAASEETLQHAKHLLVLPDEHDSQFYILLHEDLFKEDNVYCQIIAYEYARILDYAECREKYSIANMRDESCPDDDCLKFLMEARAGFKSFSLFYNLTSADRKSVIYSYLSFMVPDYEKLLNQHLPENMSALAEYYGRCLAVSYYSNVEPTMPDYIKKYPVDELLAQVHINIFDSSIFRNYDAISNAYSDFMTNKSKQTRDPSASTIHRHTCSHTHAHGHSHDHSQGTPAH